MKKRVMKKRMDFLYYKITKHLCFLKQSWDEQAYWTDMSVGVQVHSESTGNQPVVFVYAIGINND